MRCARSNSAEAKSELAEYEARKDLLNEKLSAKCIDHKTLLTLCEEVEKRLVNAEKTFSDALAFEVARVQEFYVQVRDELKAESLFPATRMAPQLSCFIQELEDFALLNVQALKLIIAWHDSVSDLKLAQSYFWKTKRDDWLSPQLLEPLLLHLSELYEIERESRAIRASSEDEKKMEELMPTTDGKVQRTQFERVSIKYWVPTDKIISLMLRILEHQSVYQFTKEDKLSQQTSSVYFDDDQLTLYTKRLAKEEGSKLIRFRWYGTMEAEKIVFLERKVHHEKWVFDKSVKERCPIAQDKVLEYIKGHPFPAESKQNALFDEIQKAIVEERLKPVLKTEYMRTAFQVPHDDSVRLTIDAQLNMLRELDQGELEKLSDWHTPTTVFLEQSIHRFPFAVLEVKLHSHLIEHPPKWLDEIWNSDLVIRMDKFSKYSHGAAALYPEIVNKALPYWFHDYAHLFAPQKRESESESYRDNERESKAKIKFDTSTEKVNNRDPGSRAHSIIKTSPTSTMQPQDSKNLSGELRKRLTTVSIKPPSIELAPDFNKQVSLDMDWESRRADLRTPKTPVRFRAFGDSRSRTKAMCRQLCSPCCGSKENKLPPRRSNARIEPKTHFANERTFLQWFSGAALMATIALTLNGLSANLTKSAHTEETAARARLMIQAGYFFFPLAGVMLIYAICMFLRRTRKLQTREATTIFADPCGPTILTLGLAAVIICICVFTFELLGDEALPPDAVLLDNNPPEPLLSHSCFQTFLRPTFSASSLSYRGTDHTLWGASDNVLFRLDLYKPSAPSYFVPTIMGASKVSTFTGIAVGPGDSLYVGSPDENRTWILEMNSSTMDIRRQYLLTPFPVRPGKGIPDLTYVPGPSGGYVLVANDEDNSIFLFRLSSNASSLNPSSTPKPSLFNSSTVNSSSDFIPVPSSPPSNNRSTDTFEATFIKEWIPLSGASRLSSIAYWPKSTGGGIIALYYLKPHVVVLFAATDEGPGQLIQIIQGFDVSSVVALAFVPHVGMTSDDNPAMAVATSTPDMVLTYDISLPLSRFSSCLIHQTIA